MLVRCIDVNTHGHAHVRVFVRGSHEIFHIVSNEVSDSLPYQLSWLCAVKMTSHESLT